MDHERSKAEEDLRVIRSLMERATVYRAISAPAALVAGLLSIFAAGAIYLNVQTGIDRLAQGRVFAAVWLVVLDLRGRDQCIVHLARSQEAMAARFFRPGMKLALRAIAPNLLIPAAVTVWFFVNRLQGRGRAGASRSVDRFLWIGVAFYRVFSHRVRSSAWGGHSC